MNEAYALNTVQAEILHEETCLRVLIRSLFMYLQTYFYRPKPFTGAAQNVHFARAEKSLISWLITIVSPLT